MTANSPVQTEEQCLPGTPRRMGLLRRRRLNRLIGRNRLQTKVQERRVEPTGRRSGMFRCGAASSLRLLLAPFGKRAARFHRELQSEERLSQGLVLLLPGIDGCTTVCDNIARGIFANQHPAALEIHDWRSFRGWNPFHLATAKKNREQAREICNRICDYQAQFPDRPIHLIGHSAGAGMTLFVLQELSRRQLKITTATLLAAAISRRFAVDDLTRATTGGIWNFWSRADLPTVGLGTLIFGTMDRKHSVSAGALGFLSGSAAENDDQSPRVHEVAYCLAMARCWNFGGHFGCTNTAFVTRYIAPILTGNIHTTHDLLSHGQQKPKRATHRKRGPAYDNTN